MPINANYEYTEAEKKVAEAKTPQEKIRALENLLSASPSHKGAEKLRQEIKQKISKLRLKLEKEQAKKGGRFSVAIKKEGAAQVVLVGLPNAGKSWILRKFTNAKTKVAEYEFTTKMPELGVMDVGGVKIQMVELPAIFEGFADAEKGPSFFGIARAADLVVIIVDGTRECEADVRMIEAEFEKALIPLEKLKEKQGSGRPCLVVVNKVMKSFKCSYPVCGIDELKHAVWSMLGLMWVRTKMPRKKPDWPPVALRKGDSVRDLAAHVHKDFVERFRFARIWGKSVRHEGANVGLDHVLAEGDIVEVHVK
ncbi:MAG TPA: GTPase [Candidatus Nanoarchaeia archaeon]|nr:GTPase [Candidatus Nanoarchaeia archaeon]